jgi:3'(2'), 5'-bisphosphate nucleotidase
LLAELTKAIADAAATIRAIETSSMAVRQKADHSPVTAADEASEAVILDHLARLLPGVAVVSEEAAAARGGPKALPSTFLLVDPLDGTREFVAGRPEYTVNIALVSERTPIAGLIAAPAQGLIWRGVIGQGASRVGPHPELGTADPTPIRTRRAPAGGFVAAVSRSHLDPASEQFLGRMPLAGRETLGSALKFCLIAEGQADVYPRLAPTCEWDIAAGHAILAAAGGIVTDPAGQPLSYGHAERSFIVPGFLAWGDCDAARRYGM